MLSEFSDGLHTIIQGDAISALRSLEEGSVNLIFADPPYNIGKDFDGIGDSVDEESYFKWCWEWLEECARVLAHNGSFYLMNSTQNMPLLDLWCRERFEIVSRIVWSYDSSAVQAKRFFGSMWEPILFMVQDRKNYTFNGADIAIPAKTGATRQLIDYRKSPPQPYNTKKVPGNVWEFPRVRFKMDEYENHPSQKPEALMRRIIAASSNPDDIVLDPFAGTFTTGAVARQLGRRSISIEKNETYVKVGLRRLCISSHYSQDDLQKKKARKTSNKSKRDHQLRSIEQSVFELEL